MIYQIVNSLGQFSRTGHSTSEDCDIHSIIDNCLVILNFKIKHKIELVKEYAKQEIVVTGNSGKLHQVFLNILSNAEQAISGEGTITIRTEVKNGMSRMTVADTGSGISDEDLKRIIDPFFTTKPPGVGTGLGLSISHAMIEEHGGKLDISSQVNKGSSFSISLPIKFKE
ncbi:MAG: ATP-binding protein [Cyclobacteriaceae bacterium]